MPSSDTILQALLIKSRPPALNPYALELSRVTDSTEEDSASYRLLVKSIEAEPYLLAQMVSVANSVRHGKPGAYFYSAEDCMRRIGIVDTQNIVLTFYVKKAVDSLATKTAAAQALWTESVSAARLARLAARYLANEATASRVYLGTLLSYLGEVFIVGHTPRDEFPGFTVYGQTTEPSVDGALNPYWATMVLLDKLEVPSPVQHLVRAMASSQFDSGSPVTLTDGAEPCIVARSIIAQQMQEECALSAPLDERLVALSVESLGLAEADIETLSKAATRLLEAPWAA